MRRIERDGERASCTTNLRNQIRTLYWVNPFSALNFKSEYALFALWDVDFDPGKAMGMFDCHAVLRLQVAWLI